MSGKKKKRRAPAGMGKRSLAFWHSVTDKYELRTDEFRILEEACRTMTLIDRMERDLKNADLVAFGSQGQPVVHPLAEGIRQQRAMLAALFRQLGLPDEEGAGSMELPRSVMARKAGKSRWAKAHGAAG